MNTQQTLQPNVNPNAPGDPNEPGISLEEKVERQRLWFEAREQTQLKKTEDALAKRLDADSQVIQLRDEMRDLKQQYRILENQHLTQFRKGVSTEAQQKLNTPEGLVKENFMRVLEEQAQFARKVARTRHTYYL